MNEQKRNAHILPLAGALFLSILILSSVARQEVAMIFSAVPDVPTAKEDALPAPSTPAPALSATAYFVEILGDSGALLHQREWKALSPASITKLLTALIAVESLGADELIPFSREAKDAGEKMSEAKIGEKFSRDDMIAFALISSANDAAYALAEATGKKEGAFTFDDAIRIFTQKMNQRARELGMSASHFKNPAGLDADGHTMSAQDIARLLEYIYDHHPNIFQIARNSEKTVQSVSGTEYRIENTNELLKEFPAILASKTGLTDKAKGALVMLYPLRNGRTASIVILGSDDRFGDGRKIIEWLEEKF